MHVYYWIMNTQNNRRRKKGRERGRKKAVGSEADSFTQDSYRCLNLVRLYLLFILLKIYFTTFLL